MNKLIIPILLIPTIHLVAQTRLPIAKITNTIRHDIETVTGDYYDHFYNIKGEKITETESTIEYQSKVVPDGASESFITEMKSLQNVYSWQALMLTTEDFEKAVEKYKQIYNQLDNANFLIHGDRLWKFRGAYDAPDESRAFASSILEPEVHDKFLQRLKIEIALSYNMPEWSVTIFVYEKENDADIRPTQRIVPD